MSSFSDVTDDEPVAVVLLAGKLSKFELMLKLPPSKMYPESLFLERYLISKKIIGKKKQCLQAFQFCKTVTATGISPEKRLCDRSRGKRPDFSDVDMHQRLIKIANINFPSNKIAA
ncbi:hypothetical protein ACH5RR_016169 [Cinchona calisaya]|uniref:Uncharacterized protein n=1 Tax=Cinchona calisaya TaxID=153742 RepID=A0ABD2ZYL7_9GENT